MPSSECVIGISPDKYRRVFGSAATGNIVPVKNQAPEPRAQTTAEPFWVANCTAAAKIPIAIAIAMESAKITMHPARFGRNGASNTSSPTTR